MQFICNKSKSSSRTLSSYSERSALLLIGTHEDTERRLRFLISLLFTAALVFLNQ